MATEEEPQVQEQVRTAADVRLDALEKEISEMKAAHAKQVEELMEANRGLYAMLQSRPEPEPETVKEPEQVPGPDPAIAAMNAALGIKEV